MGEARKSGGATAEAVFFGGRPVRGLDGDVERVPERTLCETTMAVQLGSTTISPRFDSMRCNEIINHLKRMYHHLKEFTTRPGLKMQQNVYR